MNHRPTHDWIVVLADPTARGTDLPIVNGIVHVPTLNDDIPKKKYGTVVAMGPGRPNASGTIPVPPCAIGDRVMLRLVAGERVVVEGKEYLWCIPDEIMAVVTFPVESGEMA